MSQLFALFLYLRLFEGPVGTRLRKYDACYIHKHMDQSDAHSIFVLAIWLIQGVAETFRLIHYFVNDSICSDSICHEIQ